MGTTLTGTTPQDTYDSLIKVTDNGPLSSTAKYLSDGLGNDSALALNTRNLFVGTTSAVVNYGRELVVDATALTSEPEAFVVLKGTRVSGNVAAVTFRNGSEQVGSITMQAEGNMRLLTGTTTANTSEKMRIDASGNVGIGTSSPAAKLHVKDSAAYGSIIIDNTGTTGGGTVIARQNGTNAALFGVSGAIVGDTSNDAAILAETGRSIRFFANGSATEVARITSNGLTFNGDTAAANALDDYEEGTWTPSLGGNTTYSAQAGTYTKIGRQVTVNFAVGVTTLGTGSGAVISSLPFTAGNINRGGGGIAFVQNPSTAYASINPFVGVSQNTVEFVTSTTSGVYNNASTVFTDGSIISGTVTYFV